MTEKMQWINALSTSPSLEGAISEVTAQIQQSLRGSPDLGILFISSAYASDYPRLLPLLLDKLPLGFVIGCGGGGIVGMNSNGKILEIEGSPALSLTVGHLPGVKIQPFHLVDGDLPDPDDGPGAWIECIGIDPQDNPQFILLSEPFSSRINDLLEGLDFVYPSAVKIGGLASAGTAGVPNSLFYFSSTSNLPAVVYSEGTVGLAISGEIIVETIVAQGCRPIGSPYLVTKGERNIILELSDRQDNANIGPPLEMLRNLMQSLDEKDRELAQNSLFIGLARDEFKIELKPGDFLIRNLLGVDPRVGAMAIGDRVRSGQRIQFHLRDAQTSAEDLEFLLQVYQQNISYHASPVGGLMFSCLGRGEGLYKQPNFDSTLFRQYFPGIVLGGFFCNGEIGPVAGRTFLHGYTSAFAIFRQPERVTDED